MPEPPVIEEIFARTKLPRTPETVLALAGFSQDSGKQQKLSTHNDSVDWNVCGNSDAVCVGALRKLVRACRTDCK
jgi:hypothetical protein